MRVGFSVQAQPPGGSVTDLQARGSSTSIHKVACKRVWYAMVLFATSTPRLRRVLAPGVPSSTSR